MSKIGVIGDYDSICGFAALGLDIFPAETAEEAEKILLRLADGAYGIIYLTEQYPEEMEETLQKLSERPLPAVIPIPSAGGKTGYGIRAVRRCVEQAVGSDIIFRDQNEE